MSRKKNRDLGYQNGMYWQSDAYNRRLVSKFKRQIIQLALTRFKWIGLPETCDTRFLEQTLLLDGVATIASPTEGKFKGYWFSTKAVPYGQPNVYDTPVRWMSYGNNGWRFPVNHKNGILLYDNMMRASILDDIEIYALELADAWRTRQMNRFHQKIPFIITGDQTKQKDMLNLYKQVAGGEPAILANDSARTDIKFDALMTSVPYIGQALSAEEMNIWNQIHTFLGIESLHVKNERMVEAEVDLNTQPSDLMALNPLQTRRQDLEKLSEWIGNEVSVVWNQDLVSDNFNFYNNLEAQAELDAGDTDASF